jgi:hypothetical protein
MRVFVSLNQRADLDRRLDVLTASIRSERQDLY